MRMQAMPTKKVIKPNVSMKAFHWVKVEDRNVKGTMWEHLSDDKIEFDIPAFENDFANKAPAAKSGGKGKKEEKPKVVVIELIDGKRSYNVNIAMARFRMANAAVRDAIFAMDPTVLTEEKCQTLVNCVPDEEEVSTVQSYEGDATLLGKTEQFFLEVSVIPRVKRRIELLMFKNSYTQSATELTEALRVTENSLKAIKSSRSLKKIYEIILALGNYLNGGTKKGGAYGFKINTINKLANTKTTDNKATLMHFLVKIVNEKSPNTKAFVGDLCDLPAACRVQGSMLNEQVGTLTRMVGQLRMELSKHEDNDPKDAFKRTMQQFFNESSSAYEAFATRVKNIGTLTEELADQLGEDKKIKFEDIFAMYNEFRETYVRTEEDVVKKATAAAKEAERQTRMAIPDEKDKKKTDNKSEDKEEEKKPDGKKAEAVVDKVLNNLQKRNANALSEILRARRNEKQGQKRESRTSGPDLLRVISSTRASGGVSGTPGTAASLGRSVSRGARKSIVQRSGI